MNYPNELSQMVHDEEDAGTISIDEILADLDGGEESAARFEPTELSFAPHEPSCFYESEGGTPYRGQEAAKRRLDVKIKALGPDQRIKTLLVGGAGTGKTTLARILAHRVQAHWEALGVEPGAYYELLPAQFEDKSDLDILMRDLNPHDIIFIDEVHVFKDAVGPEAMFHTLDDSGSPRYPLGNREGWVDIPPTVCWIGATTDPGELDRTTGEALRRRFGVELRLEAPGEDVLTQILLDQGFPIKENAAREIAKRSGGLPWQAITIFEEARDFSIVHGDGTITAEFAAEAFDVLGLDENGLLPEDRAALRILINMEPYQLATTGELRYKMSETSLTSAAGIDTKTYKSRVQPKLLRLGLITTVGGQTLTDRGLREYDHLKESEGE